MSRPAVQKRPPAAAPADPRWLAVRTRDPRATFFYAVRTTGIYCRPSCGARLPRPENVTFHATREDAERAGFRPCKRCAPDLAPPEERAAREISALCRFLEESETIPTLDALARRMGLSPFHTHRLFKAATGLTPRAYARARRAERVRAELGAGGNVTEAMHRAGYVSSGRFYDDARTRLGMTPTELRAGGAALVIRFALGVSSLGHVLVATTERGVCAILLGDAEDTLVADLVRRFPRARVAKGGPAFAALVADVVALVEDPRVAKRLPLDIRGTVFQERVWQALTRIPAGAVTTYSELAVAVGAPRAVRAVAGVCAQNPLAVAVPCHRVVRKGGDLAGYRWGLERKRALLDREGKAEVSPPEGARPRSRAARPARRPRRSRA